MAPSALGLIDAATPILAGSALASVDCIANKTVNSNAGVHPWHLYMAHPCKPVKLSSPVLFRASHQDDLAQYLYVRPALTQLRLKSENAASDCTVVYW